MYKKVLMLSQEQQIFEQINKANHILITFRKNWTGDSVSSALALKLFLLKLGKDAEIAAEKFSQGDLFKFLPSYSEIHDRINNLRKFIISLDLGHAKVDQIKYKLEDDKLNFIVSPKEGFFTHDDISSYSGDFKYDLIIVLDTPDLDSLGTVYEQDPEFFYKVPVINIDHHASNEGFGQIKCIELTAIATSEILFNLFMEKHKDVLDEDISTCLLCGIISETRSFKTQNISPQALSISSQLITMGARREEIVSTLYRSRSINVLRLWGRILARLNSAVNGALVWSVLTKSDFEKTQTKEKDLGDVIDELIINIPQAKIIVLIYESEDGTESQSHALIYSVKNINTLDLSKIWTGIGSRNCSKIKLSKNLSEAEKEIIDYIKEELARLID